jgi:small subunit ribosomal protein S6
MNTYETVVVFDGALPEETIAKEQQAIEAAIKESCSLADVDIWGKKTLAYPINDKKSGFYCMYNYEYDKDANAFIHDMVRYNSNVLRVLTVLATDAPIIAKKSDGASEDDQKQQNESKDTDSQGDE